MRNERLDTRGLPPQGGRKGGTSDVSPLLQRGSPSACWGLGISRWNWLFDNAGELQRPSRTHNRNHTAHDVQPHHAGTAEPGEPTAMGRGLMNE